MQQPQGHIDQSKPHHVCKDNIADVFTKPLAAPHFLLLKDKLMVCSIPIRLMGDVGEERVNNTIEDSMCSIRCA